MGQLGKVLRRSWTIFRSEGPRQLVSSAKEYLKRVSITRNGIQVSYQTGTRVDFERRWELLSQQIDSNDNSILDIGCAEGELTARFAADGLFSIGIERRAHTVSTARALHQDRQNIGFIQYEMTPKTVGSIPSVDVILLLTVYHHWLREFGWEDAEEMLAVLSENCQKLIIEVPQRKPNRPQMDLEADTVAEYYGSYLETILPGNPSVTFLSTTAYKGKNRDDIIYLIDCESTNSMSN
mgnify:CR=1 FL=1